MKRRLTLLLLSALLLAGLLAWGCSSDDDNNSVANTGTDDTSFEAFTGEFDGIQGINGLMLEVVFHSVDSINATSHIEAPAQPNPSAAATTTLVWSAAADAWVATISGMDDGEGTSFDVVDTIQFYHGTSVVQWPDRDLLTRIDSDCWLTATGEGSGTAFHHVTITRPGGDPTSTLLEVDGTGGIEAEFSFTDNDLDGTTECSGSFDYDIVYTDLVFDEDALFDDDDEMNCPHSGTANFTGSMTLACTGAHAVSLSGTWNVAEVFDNGTVTATVTHGDQTWTLTDDCGFEPDYSTDSTFISNLVSPSYMTTATRSMDIAVALLDSIPIIGVSRPEPARSALIESDYVITAVNSYSYSGGWHIFDFDAILAYDLDTDTTFIEGVDSIQVVEDGSPTQTPSSDPTNWDIVRGRAHGFWNENGGSTQGRLHHRIDVTMAVVSEVMEATISGTVRDTLAVTTAFYGYGVCGFWVTMFQDYDDLVLEVEGNGCPLDGSVTMNSRLDVECHDSQSDTDYDSDLYWVITYSGNGTNWMLTFTHGSLSWTDIGSCADNL